jgi:hypothetical protein
MYIVIYSSGDCADILDNESQLWSWVKVHRFIITSVLCCCIIASCDIYEGLVLKAEHYVYRNLFIG